jgi:preprotein translocase subunit SecF
MPLAQFDGETLSGCAWAMLFRIAIGTVSSIMTAASILLILGKHHKRCDVTTTPSNKPAADRQPG